MEPVSGKISSAPAGIAGTPIAVGWAGIGETGGQRTGRVVPLGLPRSSG